ncbi:unnamed protein product [Didymodactylos carnosus]|uniref:Uncharacterized protein n=1 Tax=Didymodactylos carnosus TaxID=1234261 RepID=A0A814HQD3_9BILA|nr:unnamed protein product [Didymodactylos carnosus]CAF3785253.1 unnamed protein product [Didymodactylos carnosus]
MFEFCTRRRLIIFIFALSFIILSIVLISQKFSISAIGFSSSRINDSKLVANSCSSTEQFDILTQCQKCTNFEKRYDPSCKLTGFKETLLCSTSQKQASRSCQIPFKIQKERFWIFEGCMFAITLISLLCVHLRQKTLDKQMVEKIKRQIGENSL